MSITLAILLLSIASADDKQGKPDAETVALLKQFCDQFKKKEINDDFAKKEYADLSKKITDQQLSTVERFASEKEAKPVRWLLIMLLAERNRFDGAACVIVQHLIGQKDKGYKLWKWWEANFCDRTDYEEFTSRLGDALLRQFEKGDKEQKLVVAELFGRGEAETKLDVEAFKKVIGYKKLTSTPEQRKLREERNKYREAASKEGQARIELAFKNFDHADSEIAMDAFRVISEMRYSDFVELIKVRSNADTRNRLKSALRSPNTPVYRLGLLGLMLGLCGNKDDAPTLRLILDDPKTASDATYDNLLVGYVLLDPIQGWEYTKNLVCTESVAFQKEYAGLRTIRFLHEYFPNLVPVKELVECVASLLNRDDIADLAVEDLRKWKQWQFTNKILEMDNRSPAPIVKRAVLRYVLSSPLEKYPAAKEYLDTMKKKKPEWVKDAQELLDYEKKSAIEDKKP